MKNFCQILSDIARDGLQFHNIHLSQVVRLDSICSTVVQCASTVKVFL